MASASAAACAAAARSRSRLALDRRLAGGERREALAPLRLPSLPRSRPRRELPGDRLRLLRLRLLLRRLRLAQGA